MLQVNAVVGFAAVADAGNLNSVGALELEEHPVVAAAEASLTDPTRPAPRPPEESQWYPLPRMATKKQTARRWWVRGRVQGVGYRYFAQKAATGLGLTGYARNLDDGRVEVYAVGSEETLSELAGMLHKGPMWSDVRGVDEQEAAVQDYGSFRIEV